MRFTLTVDMDSDVFEPSASTVKGDELGRILRNVALAVEWKRIGDGDGRRVLDANGNTVGRWVVTAGAVEAVTE